MDELMEELKQAKKEITEQQLIIKTAGEEISNLNQKMKKQAEIIVAQEKGNLIID